MAARQARSGRPRWKIEGDQATDKQQQSDQTAHGIKNYRFAPATDWPGSIAGRCKGPGRGPDRHRSGWLEILPRMRGCIYFFSPKKIILSFRVRFAHACFTPSPWPSPARGRGKVLGGPGASSKASLPPRGEGISWRAGCLRKSLLREGRGKVLGGLGASESPSPLAGEGLGRGGPNHPAQSALINSKFTIQNS